MKTPFPSFNVWDLALLSGRAGSYRKRKIKFYGLDGVKAAEGNTERRARIWVQTTVGVEVVCRLSDLRHTAQFSVQPPKIRPSLTLDVRGDVLGTIL